MILPEYKSLVEKQFSSNRIIKYKYDIDDILTEFDGKDSLIFRGVNEAKYKIYTSAQRAWLTKDLKNNTSFDRFIYELLYSLREDKLLNDFLTSLDFKYNDVLGLAMLQHYGSPSTLIDFTLDLKTALFFAIDGLIGNKTRDEIGDYMSLYYIDRNQCKRFLCSLIEVLNVGLEKGIQVYEEVVKMYSGTTVNCKLLTDIDAFTMWCNPENGGNGLPDFKLSYLGNPLKGPNLSSYKTGEKLVWSSWNLIAQKGCSIMYNEAEEPLETYMSKHQLPIHCINIHKSLADYIKMKIGINRLDIYPDLYKRIKSKYSKFLEHL